MDALPEAVDLVDPRAIRALAHPARLAVVSAFYDRGLSLTATAAARLAGTTPSAMSYHLRALERFGIVRRADPGPDGRERPWTRAAADLRIRPPGAADSRAVRGATAAVLSVALDSLRERLLDALDRVHEEELSDETPHVAGFTTATLRVTKHEAVELISSMTALLAPYREETRADVPAGAGRVTLALLAVPEADDDQPDKRS